MSKLKKFAPFLLIGSVLIVVLVLLAFIYGPRFRDVSEVGRSIGESVIAIADDFLDGRITATTAQARIDALNVRENIPSNTPNSGDGTIQGRVFLLESTLAGGFDAHNTRERVLEHRNVLARGLGMRAR